MPTQRVEVADYEKGWVYQATAELPLIVTAAPDAETDDGRGNRRKDIYGIWRAAPGDDDNDVHALAP